MSIPRLAGPTAIRWGRARRRPCSRLVLGVMKFRAVALLATGLLTTVFPSEAAARVQTPFPDDCQGWTSGGSQVQATTSFWTEATAETMAACLAAGADVMVRDPDGSTPLHLAAERGSHESVEALIAAGADVMARDRVGNTPLHLAAGWRRDDGPESVKALIAAGADVMARDEYGNSPLDEAVMRDGWPESMKALIAAGAGVMARRANGWTLLHSAAGRRAGRAETVKALIALGADVMARTEGGWTPLHSAARRGNGDLVEALIAAGAEVMARDRNGSTPLHLAALHVDPQAVKALIAAGADPNARDSAGHTPLHSWARSDFREVEARSRWYLLAGAEDPLHSWAWSDSEELLGAGVEGKSSLMAVLPRNANVIGLLLDAGARARARDVADETPWDLLQKNPGLGVVKAWDDYWRLNDARFGRPRPAERGDPGVP